MHICIVVDFYPPHIGGAEVFVSKIAEGLAAGGDRCLVITSRVDASASRVEEKENLTIVRIGPAGLASRSMFTLLAVPEVVARAKGCDLIHGASYGGAIPAYLAAKILRKRSIFMVFEFMGGLWREIESNRVKSVFYRLIEHLIARLSFDRFVAISRYTRNCLRLFGIPDAKLEFLYGGLNMEMVEPPNDQAGIRRDLNFAADDFVYACYGRAGITKGIEFFVDAIPLILDDVPQAKFLLILTKSDRHIWTRIERSLSMLPHDTYRLLPAMPPERLRDHLATADCIVIPSSSEGFGFAVLEACALNKRVVATDAGSIPEVIFGNHVMVKPRSSRLLADACLRAFRGDMDYLPPKTFQWEQMLFRLRHIYRDVLESQDRHPVDSTDV